MEDKILHDCRVVTSIAIVECHFNFQFVHVFSLLKLISRWVSHQKALKVVKIKTGTESTQNLDLLISFQVDVMLIFSNFVLEMSQDHCICPEEQ